MIKVGIKNPARLLPEQKNAHLLHVAFITLIFTGMILSLKQATIFGIITNASILTFPLVFVALYLIQDVYGEASARHAIVLGLMCNGLFYVFAKIAVALPYPSFWHLQPAYSTAFGKLANSTLLDSTALLAGSLLTTQIFTFLKKCKGFNRVGTFTIVNILGSLSYFLITQYSLIKLSHFSAILLLSIYIMLFTVPAILISNYLKIIEVEDKVSERSNTQNIYKAGGSIPHKFSQFTTVSVLFTFFFIASKAIAAKFISLHGFIFNVGSIMFPLSYIFSDVLTEVYGFQRARRLVWVAIICNLIFLAFIWLATHLYSSQYKAQQLAFISLFITQPRLILASAVSFWLGDYLNCYIIAKMKLKFGSSKVALRFIYSTAFGVSLDVTIFTFISFVGFIPITKLLWLIVCENIFKISYEVIMTPISIRISNLLKLIERSDIYDSTIPFNPFLFDVDYGEYSNKFEEYHKEVSHNEP